MRTEIGAAGAQLARVHAPLRRWGGWAMLPGGLLALILGCTGDTLYDATPKDGRPPVVRIVEPNAGEVQAGQRLPVRAVAVGEEGVSEVTLTLSGAFQASVKRTFSPARDSVAVDTAFAIPAGTSGSIELRLLARSARGVVAESEPVSLAVSATDNVAPTAALALDAPARLERTDVVRATLTARDNPGGSGLERVGVTLIAVDLVRGDTTVLPKEDPFTPPEAGEVSRSYAFSLDFIKRETLPASLKLEAHGWAVDGAGNCSAAVDGDSSKHWDCGELVYQGEKYPVAKRVGARADVLVVAGQSWAIPGGGKIADLALDTLRGRLYLSNLTRNRLHLLQLGAKSWAADVLVGAQPWGLALNGKGDSVYVANSGGTNLSVVSLGGTPTEDRARRFTSPNAALFEIESKDDKGLTHYTGTFHDFSDRPQYIAQDAQGRILYSTVPTGSAPDGTVRVVEALPGATAPEARLLVGVKDIAYADKVISIAHVDSVKLFQKAGESDRVEIYDHLPGRPDILIQSGNLPLDSAIASMEAQNSDILWAPGRWVLERVAFSDTTYVATSGDRQWVAFGEGGKGTPGRVIFWHAPSKGLSYEVSVADLVHNANERVRGLDLNRDGTFGAARGDQAAYFFTTDLRLQGSFTDQMPGGAGAALHPVHPTFGVGAGSSASTLSFVGTGNRTIKIVDTVHYTERGEIAVRDNIIGPLRSGPPLASDRQACATGPSCVVAKLYGLTAAGVVVIDVLASDIKSLP